jgi:hypothetical protein
MSDLKLGLILDYFAVIKFYLVSLAVVLFLFFVLHNIVNTICMISGQSHSDMLQIKMRTQIYLL